MKSREHKISVQINGQDAPPLEVQKEQNYLWDIWVVRVIFALTLTLTAYAFEPFGLRGLSAVALGLVCAVGIVYFEHLLKRATLKRLIGAAVGSILGMAGAALISFVLNRTGDDAHLNSLFFATLFVLVLMT
jgi:hypothetical protein